MAFDLLQIVFGLEHSNLLLLKLVLLLKLLLLLLKLLLKTVVFRAPTLRKEAQSRYIKVRFSRPGRRGATQRLAGFDPGTVVL